MTLFVLILLSSHINKIRQAKKGGKNVKKIALLSLILFIIVIIILPAFIVRGCNFTSPSGFPLKKQENSPLKKGQPKKNIPTEQEQIVIRVYRTDLKKVVEMDLEEYLKGVVAAEMPVSFDLEALKAQAIAARTYSLKRMKNSRQDSHLSTNFESAQDWASEARLKEKWGEANYFYYWNKISQAVEQTRGLVLTYQGSLINAYYHSTCGGKTEDGETVFKHFLPYLKPIRCYTCNHSPRFREQKDFPIAQVKSVLGLDSQQQLNLKVLERTIGGRVKTIQVGGKEVSGLDFRKLLGLRSTRFSWQAQGDQISFITIGNGHGVGMCQYGADGLAKQGKDFQQILRYYYQGVEIQPYRDIKN